MTIDRERNYYLGIDVGTGSARAGIFDGNGRMAGSAAFPIKMWKPQVDYVEQSSDDIWGACCSAINEAMTQVNISADQIRGIGIDATCSLVVLDADDRPITVSSTGIEQQNVIVWMDHRAIKEANEINATKHEVLQYVGGVISPEMQTPKLLWLKRNLPDTWNQTARFLDLPDFLVYRATGVDVRSLCTTVCKWTYLGHELGRFADSTGRWEDSYFRQIGLGDLVDEGYRRIGTRVRPMGEAAGNGLTPAAAKEMGLNSGTPVGVGIIDAHAGGIGMLGMQTGEEQLDDEQWQKRLALIGGTSSCHMAVSQKPAFIAGIWGPYYSAMLPGYWLTEGGQSATGALIDHIIFSHARGQELQSQADKEGKTVYQALNERLIKLSGGYDFPAKLTNRLHVLPYFHGNRSPRADASLVGAISGLKLSLTLDDLALQYFATIQAIAYGTRHIIEEMNKDVYRIDMIIACGGGTKNPVFLREHADITGCRIMLPKEPEVVLLGSAILGAVAAGDYGSVMDAMSQMSAPGEVIEPGNEMIRDYHDAKYKIFHRMYADQIAYDGLMGQWR